MQKNIIFFLIASIVIYLGLILFANRALLASRFDERYWKDRYDHSQWKLPVSNRTIGDDGLFLYEGYRLIKGDNPADYNAEVPPLGKYLIGASILLFGNGHWYGFIIPTLTIVAFFVLAKILLKDTAVSLAVTLLLLTDPLLTSQFPLTMLDSLQLFFLLLILIVLVRILITKSHPLLFAITLGIPFGLFSGAKTPILSPFVGIILLVILWNAWHSPKAVFLFVVTAFFSYLLPYAQFFFLKHSLGDWIGVQRWMVGFYKVSLLRPNTGSAITTLLFNRTQNLFTHAWEIGSQWSPTWPFITLISIGAFILKKQNRRFVPVILVAILLLIVFSLIPFWTRYLLLILPLLYLSAAGVFMKQKFARMLFLMLLGANIIASLDILFPTPQATIKNFTYAWEHGFFSDMYEQLASSSKTVNRQSFHHLGLQTYYDGQIEGAKIEILPSRWSRWKSLQMIPLRITYFTRELGPFTEARTIVVVNENGRWVIPWQWNYFIERFDETKHVETLVMPAKRGSIIDTKGNLLAWDTQGVMVWITPKDVDQTQEERMLKALDKAFVRHPGAVMIHHRYVGNTLPNRPIPIGTLAQPITVYPGMSVTPHLVRIASESGKLNNTVYKECCSLLYSTTNYDGITGLEQQYNDQLKGKNGGSLVIKDQQGVVVWTVLNLLKRDGNDVVIDKQ